MYKLNEYEVTNTKNIQARSLFSFFRVKTIAGDTRLKEEVNYVFSKIFKHDIKKLKSFFAFLGIVLAFAIVSEQLATESLLLSGILTIFMLAVLFINTREASFNPYDVGKFVVFGGLASLVLVVGIRTFTGYPAGILGDFFTAFLEEGAKIFIVVVLAKKFTLHTMGAGLLLGFAVGAGFDMFETSDYGIYTLLEGGDYASYYSVTLWRTLYAVLGIGHHFWTGILAAVLIHVKRHNTVRFSDLFHPVFVGVFIAVMTIHALWNFFATIEISPWADLLGTVSLMVISIGLFLVFLRYSYYDSLLNFHRCELVFLKEDSDAHSNNKEDA